MASRFGPLAINGTNVHRVGYGMMSLTLPGNNIDHAQAVKLLKSALNNGVNCWNASIHYGTKAANSLHLLHAYFKAHPEDATRVVLTLKGCYTREDGLDCSAAGIRRAAGEALRVLDGVKKIDVFTMSRKDPRYEIEDIMATFKELVEEGKIGSIGLSEVSAQTLCRASAVHKVALAEIELSLFTPDPLYNGIVDTCRELGITAIAYSPIGRGFLTGNYTKFEDIPADDYRHRFPRFSKENFDQNMRLVDAVKAIAEKKGVTTAQVALAWVVAQGVIPIPGSTNEGRIAENSSPPDLTDGELEDLTRILKEIPTAGQRYGGEHELKLLNG